MNTLGALIVVLYHGFTKEPVGPFTWMVLAFLAISALDDIATGRRK